MSKVVANTLLTVACICYSLAALAQKKSPQNWQLLSPAQDNVYGMGVEEAYKLLAGRKPETVIVAVIDSGVDTAHADLNEVIWTNEDEIPNNGIDDDNNGYIDDVNGWSFIGGKKEDLNYAAFELGRIHYRLSNKFKNVDSTSLSEKDLKEFEYYKTIQEAFDEQLTKFNSTEYFYGLLVGYMDKVRKLNLGKFTRDGLKNAAAVTPLDKKLKKILLKQTKKEDPEKLYKDFVEAHETYTNWIKFNTSDADSIRAAIIGDDPKDTTNRIYGCNRVIGPDAIHGTHVAGIIAAVRNNNIGMDGVADNVRIMPVRAVPNGDERDKDVANAIRYAVDNGAHIINMSFGKGYPLNKRLVDEAVMYALSKDVLLVHAAGNDAKNCDLSISYPNRNLDQGVTALNWLQVGASDYKKGKKLLASFSNYGKQQVDVFAPGYKIYSTTPDSSYQRLSGTSMASPSTAGAAALLKSYFPHLSAIEIRNVLMKTVTPYTKKVIVPGSSKKYLLFFKKHKKQHMAELCVSGGFVNVYNAVVYLLAEESK